MAKMTLIEGVNDALKVEMERDENVVILGEDIGKLGGVFRATEGLFDKFGEKRVIDTPLAEAGLVGSSIGMAIYGLKPVVEIQFMGFIYPGFDQIVSHAARIRNRSRGRFHVPLVIRMPYSGGIHAPEHHSESTEALLTHIPGLKVVIPSTPSDAKGLLISAIRDPDPVIFLEPKKIYRAFKEEVPEGDYTVPLGKARIARQGKDVSVFAWGAMVPVCLDAAEQMQQKNIDVEVIDLRTLMPFDIEAILASVKKTGRAVIVHEASKTCGFGAELVAQLNERALFDLQGPVKRVTGFDTVIPLAKLENDYLPDAFRVSKAIEEQMSF